MVLSWTLHFHGPTRIAHTNDRNYGQYSYRSLNIMEYVESALIVFRNILELGSNNIMWPKLLTTQVTLKNKQKYDVVSHKVSY